MVKNYGKAHQSAAMCCISSNDGEYIFTAGIYGFVKQWSVQEQKLHRDFGKIHDYPIYSIICSQDDERLFTTDCMGNLMEFYIETGTLIKDHQNISKKDCWRLQLSKPHGKTMFCVELSGAVRQWSTDDVIMTNDFGNVHAEGCLTIALGPKGNFFFTGGRSGSVKKWDLKSNSGQCLKEIEFAHDYGIRMMMITH